MTAPVMGAAPQPPARKGLGRGSLSRLIFGLVGVLLLAAGVVLAALNLDVVLRDPTTTGTIVRLETYEDRTDNDNRSSSTTRFRPIYQYKVGAEFYENSGPGAKDYNFYKVGQTVSVRYEPEHPEQGTIDGFQQWWLAPLELIILGLPFSAIGYVALSSLLSARAKKPGAAT